MIDVNIGELHFEALSDFQKMIDKIEELDIKEELNPESILFGFLLGHGIPINDAWKIYNDLNGLCLDDGTKSFT